MIRKIDETDNVRHGKRLDLKYYSISVKNEFMIL